MVEDYATLIVAGSALLGALIGAILSPLVNGWVRRSEIIYNFTLGQTEKSYEMVIQVIIKILQIFEDMKMLRGLDSLEVMRKHNDEVQQLIDKIPPLSFLFISKKTKTLLGKTLLPLRKELDSFNEKIIEKCFDETKGSKKSINFLYETKIKKIILLRDSIFEEARKDLGVRKK